jgi:hypothetical protein
MKPRSIAGAIPAFVAERFTQGRIEADEVSGEKD